MKFLFLTYIVFTVTFYSQTTITGRVTDNYGSPLPFVNIYILGTTDGTVSDSAGFYKFKTNIQKSSYLIASSIGFKKYKKQINFEKKYINENIKLEPEVIELDKAIVLGSTFSNVKGKGVVLTKIDILTTPGGAADVFQSLKTLPGLTRVNESAELFVRGGDPYETKTLLDKAPFNHPYTLESTQGGIFSKLNTSNISNLYFSSGGFSAKYGNVLSGIVDIKTKQEVLSDNYNLGISLAEVSGNIQKRFGNNFSAILSFNKSYTGILSSLFMEEEKFRLNPTSSGFFFSGNVKFNKKSKLKITTQHNYDNQEVLIERPEINSFYKGNSKSNFYNILFNSIISETFITKANFSFCRYFQKSALGNLDIENREDNYHTGIDFIKFFTNRFELNFGLEAAFNDILISGKLPTSDYDLKNRFNTKSISDKFNFHHIGFYGEIKKENLFGYDRIFFVSGARFDKVSIHSKAWLDIRAGLGYKTNTNSLFKISFGTFHQNQNFRYLSKTDGSPELKPMFSEHIILSYSTQLQNDGSLQTEAYYKKYENLPLEDSLTNYNNNGFGYSYGMDIILKKNINNIIEGWLSYGFLKTKRKWKDYKKLTRSEFDITHNLSLILKYNLNFNWQIGLNFALASGKPYTPVIGNNYSKLLRIYKPLYGEKNSARMDIYNRVDLRILHFTNIFNKMFAVIYLEGLNIFNTPNIIDYTYNFDYSAKKGIKSYFGERMIVLGISIDLK